MVDELGRRRISDVRTLAALAHPLRLALLDAVMSLGPRTASECADVVGSTPSNCSYHLRYLARFGLVERVGAEDGRERPWRAAAAGFTMQADDAGPASVAAETTLAAAQVDQHSQLAHAYLRRVDPKDPDWRRFANFSAYGLLLNADELARLGDALDELIRPYRGLTREDPPEDAQPVHLTLHAFRHPEAP